MKKNINSHRRMFTFILILVIVIACALTFFLYKPSRNIFESVSVILAIPSFLITVFVLNVLNVTPNNLDRYYQSRKLKDSETEMIRSEFIDFLNEHFATTKNTVNKFANYLDHKNAGTKINANLVNECKSKYNDLKVYYAQTKKYVKNETLDIVNVQDSLSALDSTDYSGLKMSNEDLDKLRRSLDQLSNDFFTQDQLSHEKLELLKEVFDREDGLFQKYFSICNVTFKNLGGEINE